MTEEKYQEIKESYIKNIKRFMTDMGGVFPHISVFGSHKDGDEKDAIIHIPIPDEFMKSDADALLFIDGDHGFNIDDVIRMVHSG